MKKISLIILSFLLVGSFFFGQVFGQVEEAKASACDTYNTNCSITLDVRPLKCRSLFSQCADENRAKREAKAANKGIASTVRKANKNLDDNLTAKAYKNPKVDDSYKIPAKCQAIMGYCDGGESGYFAGDVPVMCGKIAAYCIQGDAINVKRSLDGSCSWNCKSTQRICYYEKCGSKTRLLYAVVLSNSTYCTSGSESSIGSSNSPNNPILPSCGSVNGGDFLNPPPVEQRCNPGTDIGFASTDQGWQWKCNYLNKTTGFCTANKIIPDPVLPSCTISPNPIRVCPDQKSTISITSLVPADGTLSWAGNGSASPDKKSYEMGAGTATLTVTKNSKTGDCSASVQAKPAGCTVSLDEASNLTVGKTATVSIEPSCLKKPYSYSLSPSDNWSYPNGSSDINDGTATIKVEKAGTLNFDATVSGNGQTVNCSSQASAFTSGSEWWERKPE